MNIIVATNIANNILKRAFEQNVEVTPMKLQRIIYFIYRDYLQTTGQSLFSERFEVWRYGPVLPTVYQKFRPFNGKPITEFAKDSKGEVLCVTEKVESDLRKIIDNVWYCYKDYNGVDLSKITHQKNSAWYHAFQRYEIVLNNKDIQNEVNSLLIKQK